MRWPRRRDACDRALGDSEIEESPQQVRILPDPLVFGFGDGVDAMCDFLDWLWRWLFPDDEGGGASKEYPPVEYDFVP